MLAGNRIDMQHVGIIWYRCQMIWGHRLQIPIDRFSYWFVVDIAARIR